MHEIGIERLCVFGMPPVEFVCFTAQLGCTCIGIAPEALRDYNPHNYPDWSLRTEPALRREMVAAMRDTGVRISLFDGFAIAPGRAFGDIEPDLDLLCELGGERINLVGLDKDRERTFDGFAAVTEMAAKRGIEVTTEVGSLLGLRTALRAVQHVAKPNFKLLLDTMHFFRFGSTLDDLAPIDPELIGYVQLCDAPWTSEFADYRDEALHERRCPGLGDLPLRALLRQVRAGVVVSIEIPQRSLAEAGLSPMERVRPCVEATRMLLSEV